MSAVSELIAALGNPRNTLLVEAAAEALGKIADPRALAALRRVAKSGELRPRLASQTAILRIRKRQEKGGSAPESS